MKVVVAIVKPKGKYIIYMKSFLSTWAAVDLYSHRYATMPAHWNQPNEASRDWWTQWVVNNCAVILIPWKNLNIGKIPESYKSTEGVFLQRKQWWYHVLRSWTEKLTVLGPVNYFFSCFQYGSRGTSKLSLRKKTPALQARHPYLRRVNVDHFERVKGVSIITVL